MPREAVATLCLYSWYHISSRSTVQTETIGIHPEKNTTGMLYDDHCMLGNAKKCLTRPRLRTAKPMKLVLKEKVNAIWWKRILL